MDTINELFQEQIKDLHSAEKQLVKAIPRMIKAASCDELKKAFQSHLNETEMHITRLEKIAKACGFSPTGKVCNGMKGLLEEAVEAAGEEGDDAIVDAGLIAAAQRVEHYEIAGYGTSRRLATLAGYDDHAKTLSETLDDENAANRALTDVAETVLYPSIMAAEERELDSDDDEESDADLASSKPKTARATTKK